jgi:hypothetical protein
MGIDDLRARLDRLLREQGLGGSTRHEAGALHDALLDLKVALKDLQDATARTEREIRSERDQLAAAERRGRLAQDINDAETARIAVEFSDRHRQRIDLLERKLAVQRDEQAIAQREYETLAERYRAAKQGIPSSSEPTPAASDDGSEQLRSRLDRRAVESAVDAQLEMLKKKMGKGP